EPHAMRKDLRREAVALVGHRRRNGGRETHRLILPTTPVTSTMPPELLIAPGVDVAVLRCTRRRIIVRRPPSVATRSSPNGAARDECYLPSTF
ncbi:MAG TPA: hypothetical protein VGW38_12245, partial [Chloroflexota bacterium]|nr:hypothetical protein [Chloroflexota bacterium]